MTRVTISPKLMQTLLFALATSLYFEDGYPEQGREEHEEQQERIKDQKAAINYLESMAIQASLGPDGKPL